MGAVKNWVMDLKEQRDEMLEQICDKMGILEEEFQDLNEHPGGWSILAEGAPDEAFEYAQIESELAHYQNLA